MSLSAIAFALKMGVSAAAQAPTTPAAPAKTAQHTRRAMCNKDATGKKGDERKAFMKECLSKSTDRVAPTARPSFDKDINWR